MKRDMCSRRILRELVMHMLVSTNGVNVYGESTYTQRSEKDIFDIFLPCMFPYVCTGSYKILGSLGCHKPYLCVMTSDVRILNITLDLMAREPLDP